MIYQNFSLPVACFVGHQAFDREYNMLEVIAERAKIAKWMSNGRRAVLLRLVSFSDLNIEAAWTARLKDFWQADPTGDDPFFAIAVERSHDLKMVPLIDPRVPIIGAENSVRIAKGEFDRMTEAEDRRRGRATASLYKTGDKAPFDNIHGPAPQHRLFGQFSGTGSRADFSVEELIYAVTLSYQFIMNERLPLGFPTPATAGFRARTFRTMRVHGVEDFDAFVIEMGSAVVDSIDQLRAQITARNAMLRYFI